MPVVVGVYGKRACREATEWRLVPKVIKGGVGGRLEGECGMWPARREVRDYAELNQPSAGHGPVTVHCPKRGVLRDVVG